MCFICRLLVGAAVQGLGDYLQGETSEAVSEFVKKILALG